MEAFFATNVAIFALQKGLTSLFWLELSRKATYTTKVSYPGLKAVAANFFFY